MENQQTSAQQHNPAGNASTDRSENRRSRIAKERVDRMKETVGSGANWSLVVPIFINFAMVIVGSLAFGKCPVEPYIPFYLVAVGVVGFTGKCITALRQWSNAEYVKTTQAETALYAVEIMLFIFGSFWVYKEYPPSYDPHDGEKYCQKTAYLFAFTLITISLAFLLLLVAVFPCFLLCICFVVGTSGYEDDVEANIREGEASTHAGDADQV